MSILTIGLTGGIGSGKSYVANIFKLMGVPVYNSDDEAKILMTKNDSIRSKIKKLLGKKSYLEDGTLDKFFIAQKIFSDSSVLEKMNKIVHPAVRSDFSNWAKKRSSAPYVINEAALFVENGSYDSFDALLTVVSPKKLRIKRVKERSGMKEEEILQRMSKQSSDQEKISKSNFLIYNDYSTNLLFQCRRIHHKILAHDLKK